MRASNVAGPVFISIGEGIIKLTSLTFTVIAIDLRYYACSMREYGRHDIERIGWMSDKINYDMSHRSFSYEHQLTFYVLLHFLPVGDQLKLFLENNPKIPAELMLVDDYSFEAFNGAGFGKIGENAELAVKGTKNMKAPALSFGRFMSYFKSVGKLAPIPKNVKGIPEGVLRLGGTFGVDGKKVVYLYEDGVPGDHPIPYEVLSSSSFIKNE